MKLIKIGSAQSNDIVLQSQYVSAFHAELTILDSGEIILEDKDSRNGTFVGNKRIEPNTEVTIRRGDFIRFADTDLVWAKVPSVQDTSRYKTVVNIGSNFRNDIVLNSGVVSRYHAAVYIKGRKAFIRDNNSKNGTQVNGVKIPAGREISIRKGDNILCAGEDVSLQLSHYLPKSYSDMMVKLGAVVLACLILTGGVFWAFNRTRKISPEKLIPSVVYLSASYQYLVEFEDNPLPEEVWSGVLAIDAPQNYCGTAFFVDREGRMATNRHIARPWEYRTKATDDYLRNAITSFVANVTDDNESLESRLENDIFNAIFEYGMRIATNGDWKAKRAAINTLLSRLSKSDYEIKGRIVKINVGYPGLFYDPDDFPGCNVLRVSDSKDIDLALLQLNDKQTPERVKSVFSIDDIYRKEIIPLKDNFYTIGYPLGEYMAKDVSTKTLKPTIRKMGCSKVPGKWNFELQESSVGGTSGSPIFNDHGQLVGVLFGGYNGVNTLAVHARFLKKLYDEEVNYLE